MPGWTWDYVGSTLTLSRLQTLSIVWDRRNKAVADAASGRKRSSLEDLGAAFPQGVIDG